MFSEENVISRFVFDTSSRVLYPVISCYDAIANYIVDTKNSVGNIWNASQENIALKLENARLQKILSENSIIKSENIELKKNLKFIDNSKSNIIVSGRMVATFNGMYSRGGILDIGLNNNIKKNQVVIAQGNIVGKIGYVADHYSKIQLTTDINSRIPVTTSIS
jgi:rod shape-determining protein MreC